MAVTRLLFICFLTYLFCIGMASAESEIKLRHIIIPNTGAESAVKAVEGKLKEQAGVLPVRLTGRKPLYEILNEQCPGSTNTIRSTFANDVAALNPGQFSSGDVSLETMAGGSGYGITTIYIPYCLGALNETYEVQNGDTIWSIFRERSATDGIKDWGRFSTEIMRLNELTNLNDNLPVGEKLSVPSESWRVPVEDQMANRLVRDLEKIESVGKSIGLTDSQIYKDQLNESGCKADDEIGALLRSEKALLNITETLLYNDVLGEKFNLRRKKDVLSVAILDTGIETSHEHPTIRRMVKPLIPPGDDHLSFPADPRSHHGTGVLFTATGGYFLSALNPLGITVQAEPFNLFVPKCENPNNCVYFASHNKLKQALRTAFKRLSEVSIVNISVDFPEDSEEPFATWFTDYFGPDKSVLITTSSGNDGQLLTGGTDAPVYPADYGGNDSGNLITVAAVDMENQLLPQSNYSERIVDMAAWGCNVPVIEFEPGSGRYIRKLRSGTSYAAPHVAFAAALIKREKPRNKAEMSPSDLKIRLVTGADMNLGLWNKVRHGRTLNYAKALSVHTDVIELKDENTLLRGRTAFDDNDSPQSIVHLCGDHSVKREELLSIVDLGQSPAVGTGRYLIYRKSNAIGGAKIETLWCNGLTPKVTLVDLLNGEKRELNFEDIASITMATYPLSAR